MEVICYFLILSNFFLHTVADLNIYGYYFIVATLLSAEVSQKFEKMNSAFCSRRWEV